MQVKTGLALLLAISLSLGFPTGPGYAAETEGWRLFKQGDASVDSQKYPEALQALNKARAFAEKHKDKVLLIEVLSDIGRVYRAQGDFTKALAFQQECLNLVIKIHGTEHRDVAAALGNIGGIYEEQGKYDDALASLTKALSVLLKVTGPKSKEVAQIYTVIASVHADKGDPQKALSLLKKGLQIAVGAMGENDLSVAAIYGNMGNILGSLGEFAPALENLKKALAINLKRGTCQ